MMTMKNIVKKIGMMLLTMVIVSFFAFLAFQIIPGDPTTKLLGSDPPPPAATCEYHPNPITYHTEKRMTL